MKKVQLLLVVIMFHQLVFAQKSKLPLSITPTIGMNYNMLNKNVYNKLPYDISKQYGLSIKFGISKHIALGIEGEYRKFNLGDNIGETYYPLLGNQLSSQQFGRSSNLNGLLNLSYYTFSKNQKSLFEIGLGGGVQQLTQQATFITFNNPLVLNAVDTLYHHGNSKKISPIVQCFMQYTFFPVRYIGINLGVKAQYAPNLYTVTYKTIEGLQANSQGSFAALCETKTITQTAFNPPSIIPTLGITIKFGGPRNPKNPKTPKEQEPPKEDKEDKKPKTGCFSLAWKNQPRGNKCFNEDQLKFGIAAANNYTNVVKYEVSIAPINDLNNPQYLFDVPYPSNSFNINTNVFDASKKYIVIVKMVYLKEGINCVQTISTIERCNEPCTILPTSPKDPLQNSEVKNRK